VDSIQVEKYNQRFSIKAMLSRIPKWLKGILIIVFIILIVTASIAIINKNKGVPVSAVEITRQDIVKTVFTNGRLEAVHEQQFFTPVDSTLMELNVKLGDRVSKGRYTG